MRTFAILFFLVLSSCDLTSEETGDYPWMGYALQRDRGRYEYFLSHAYQTHQDRIEITRKLAGISDYYGEPIGCSYFSNSYWRVLLFSLLYPDEGLGCIYRSTDSRQFKMKYFHQLKGRYIPLSHGRCVVLLDFDGLQVGSFGPFPTRYP